MLCMLGSDGKRARQSENGKRARQRERKKSERERARKEWERERERERDGAYLTDSRKSGLKRGELRLYMSHVSNLITNLPLT